MPSPLAGVVIDDLTFVWPDGTPAISGLTASLGRGSTGLVGANGVGKSTLLALVAGRLAPTSGTVTTLGRVDHVPQDLTLAGDATLADLLGVRAVVDAVRAIEAGHVTAALLDTVGDDWDLEYRAVAALDAIGLPSALDRPAATLSGGEVVLAAVTGIRLRQAPVALLDEPTNNLDADSRARLYDLVTGWRGALVVVSHDTELLDLMDATAELRDGSLTVFGGGYSQFAAAVELEQQAARQALRTAEQVLRTERRQRVEAEQRIAHAERQGRKDQKNRKYIGAVVNDRRNSAERSAGARRGMLDARVAAARTAVDAAGRRVRSDDRIRVDLPDPRVPAGRRLACLTGSDGRQFVVQGPERLALTGANGVGKTTLVEGLVAGARRTPPLPRGESGARAEAFTDRVGYLPQRLDALADDASVLANIEAAAPGVPTALLRDRLARFLLRGDAVARPAATLSGGERFRVSLAVLLLADPPADLLVLDEPTNNLDLASVQQLVDALAGYRGALLVISHDRGFLARLDLAAELVLHPDGRLARQDAPRRPG